MAASLLLTACALFTSPQAFTEHHVEVLISDGDPIDVDDPLGASWRWIGPSHLRSATGGGWTQFSAVTDDAGRNRTVFIGQRPGQLDGPLEFLAGPGLLDGRKPVDFDMAGPYEAAIMVDEGTLENRTVELNGQVVVTLGSEVAGSNGWVWSDFLKVTVALNGRLLVAGKAIDPSGTSELIMAADITAGSVLFDGLGIVPGLTRRIERMSAISRLEMSPDGQHWAADVILVGSPFGSALLYDGAVYEFEPGFPALRDAPAPPAIAAATGANNWFAFYVPSLSSRGDVALFASTYGGTNSPRLAAYRNGRLMTNLNGGALIEVNEDGGLVMITGSSTGAATGTLMVEGRELISESDAGALPVDLDRDGIVDPSHLFEMKVTGAVSTAANWLIAEGFLREAGASAGRKSVVRVRDHRLGSTICEGEPNSTGRPGGLMWVGDSVTADNNVTVEVFELPEDRPGYVLLSQETGVPFQPPGSQGRFCLGGSVGRLQSQLFVSQANGQASVALDLTSFPQPTGAVAVVAGETWVVQAWHRDTAAGAATSNFTSAASVTFR